MRAAGTVVSAVSVPMPDGSAFTGTLAASPSGTVTISGKNLVLARALTSADNGQYQWSAAATQNGVTVSGSIPVQVNAIPTGVSFTPSAASLADNAPAGTTVAAVSVSMSDGSAFTGTLAANPTGTVAISGNKLVFRSNQMIQPRRVRPRQPAMLRGTAVNHLIGSER